MLKALEEKGNADRSSSTRSTPSSAPAPPGGAMDASNLSSPRSRRAPALHRLHHATRSTARTSRRTGRSPAASSRIEVAEPSIDEPSRSSRACRPQYEEFHGVTLHRRSAARRRRARRALPARPQAARQGDRPPRRGRRRRQAAARGEAADATVSGRATSRRWCATMAQHPAAAGRVRRQGALKHLETDSRAVFGQDEAVERLAQAIKLRAPACGAPAEADRLFLFTGPTGVGKTELAKQLAEVMGINFLRFDMSEYMERAHRLAPHRRAARLRRLRPGRPAHRRHRQDAARGAAARRDREGAPGRLQHPAPGDGPRHADRQQRQPTDFRHVILLMTSNVGARDLSQAHARLRRRRRATSATPTRLQAHVLRPSSATASTRRSTSTPLDQRAWARSSTSSCASWQRSSRRRR